MIANIYIFSSFQPLSKFWDFDINGVWVYGNEAHHKFKKILSKSLKVTVSKSITLLVYFQIFTSCTHNGVKKKKERKKLCVQPGTTSDIISLFCVTRVSPHQLLNQYFMVIHNFLSIIHDNVCVVYLIVLLTIKSNFLKILKDAN